MQVRCIELQPALSSKISRDAFVAYARALARVRRDPDYDEEIDDLRESFVTRVLSCRRSDRQFLLAAGLVLTDLVVQGWRLRVLQHRVTIRPPEQVSGDPAAEKARVRRQELVKRDAQLRQPSVQKFIASMETRVFGGSVESVYALMRDGRQLADALRQVRRGAMDDPTVLAQVIDPYLQFVSSDQATCSFTGLRLMDVWRYFRHTWTNQYNSVPGRTMMFLVRDRAAPCHPIIGIGALSSPVMQIRERDTWIGWHPDTFIERIRVRPTCELAKWLIDTVDAAIGELYLDDFLEDAVISARDITSPTEDVLERLQKESAEQRRLHHRYVRSRDHKVRRGNLTESEHWMSRARMHLFRSKRAIALASYLRARNVLQQAFGDQPTADRLSQLASTAAGMDAIRRVLKKAKADRIGISVADLTVCGAVQPYNAILGGKLVAMLAASPEIVLEYQRRYSDAESEIASAMAGRAITRTPTLALLGTTSLYGIGSSQYNRIKIPCDRVGGLQNEMIEYAELGHSNAFGTSQYSQETIDALVDVVQQSANGQRVNSIFGEGISPKLRKIREGLSLIGLPADVLLQHHRRRVVYAVNLIRNLREHLLGIDPDPSYLLPIEDGPTATARIVAWWRERWLRNRIASDDVLADVARHTLVRPVRHGARVIIPSVPEQEVAFADQF